MQRRIAPNYLILKTDTRRIEAVRDHIEYTLEDITRKEDFAVDRRHVSRPLCRYAYVSITRSGRNAGVYRPVHHNS